MNLVVFIDIDNNTRKKEELKEILCKERELRNLLLINTKM